LLLHQLWLFQVPILEPGIAHLPLSYLNFFNHGRAAEVSGFEGKLYGAASQEESEPGSLSSCEVVQ
jgi:hypothetical protein